MSAVNERFLDHLFFTYRDRSAWLYKLTKLFKLNRGEVDYLVNLDEIQSPAIREHKKTLNNLSVGFFSDDEAHELRMLSEHIAEAYHDYEVSFRKDLGGAIDRQFMLAWRRIPECERRRREILRKTYHKEHYPNGSITEEQIERARKFPLEKLIGDQLTRHGYTKCRWHDDDKPSMLVKKGYAYCFSCGAWADSIKWLMVVNRWPFKDAVKYLAGL